MPPTKRPAVAIATKTGTAKRTRPAAKVIVNTAAKRTTPSTAAATSSSTTSTDSALYSEFIQLLSSPPYKGRGISNNALRSHFTTSYAQLVPIINELTRASRLTMSTSKHPTPGEAEVHFSLLGEEEASKLQGLDGQAKMVYQVVEGAGNKGIWTVDVRVQTNIQQATLTKIFKVRYDWRS
jgi:hypothetical protein